MTKYLLILISSFTLISCYPKKKNFSVTTPKGWILIDSLRDNRRFVTMRPLIIDSVPVFVENINIGIMRSANIDDYIKNILAEAKRNFIYFEEKGNGSIKQNEKVVKWIQHLIKTDNNSELVEQKVYFITDNGTVFQIVCTAKTDSIQKMQDKIDTVLNSFKIL